MLSSVKVLAWRARWGVSATAARKKWRRGNMGRRVRCPLLPSPSLSEACPCSKLLCLTHSDPISESPKRTSCKHLLQRDGAHKLTPPRASRVQPHAQCARCAPQGDFRCGAPPAPPAPRWVFPNQWRAPPMPLAAAVEQPRRPSGPNVLLTPPSLPRSPPPSARRLLRERDPRAPPRGRPRGLAPWVCID